MWNLHAADSCANHKGRQICVCYPFITLSMCILLYIEMFTKDKFHNLWFSVKILRKIINKREICENHVCGFQEEGRL